MDFNVIIGCDPLGMAPARAQACRSWEGSCSSPRHTSNHFFLPFNFLSTSTSRYARSDKNTRTHRHTGTPTHRHTETHRHTDTQSHRHTVTRTQKRGDTVRDALRKRTRRTRVRRCLLGDRASVCRNTVLYRGESPIGRLTSWPRRPTNRSTHRSCKRSVDP